MRGSVDEAGSSRHNDARGRARPVRTCAGCRARAPQAELLRVGVVAGRIVADPGRRVEGRGAYVHRRRECVERAARGGLARALRARVDKAEVFRLVECFEGGETVFGRVLGVLEGTKSDEGQK